MYYLIIRQFTKCIFVVIVLAECLITKGKHFRNRHFLPETVVSNGGCWGHLYWECWWEVASVWHSGGKAAAADSALRPRYLP